MNKLSLLPLIALLSCASNGAADSSDSETADSVVVESSSDTVVYDDTAETESSVDAAIEREQIAFLDQFYQNAWYENPRKLKSVITNRMKSQLIRANPYEDGMAYWELYRPCCQDSGKPIYLGATKISDNTYVVAIKDAPSTDGGGCGKTSRIRLKLTGSPSNWKIDSYKVLN